LGASSSKFRSISESRASLTWSLRLPLNIFTFDLYQSLRGTRMIQIGCGKYLKIKKSTAKSGQKLPMNPFSMLYNSLTGHCWMFLEVKKKKRNLTAGWNCASISTCSTVSHRYYLNIFTFDLYQSLRGTRMIQIGCEKYLKIKKSTAKSGQKLPMNSFSMFCNFLTGHYW